MISYIYEAIGNLFGVERPPEELGDPIDFEPGILLDSGISWIYIFRKFLIPIELRTSKLCPSNCECERYGKCKT
ncbi:unnamed protein product [Tenebrio molitor]|nr:unnamed protein product [Tenebrio molitor]